MTPSGWAAATSVAETIAMPRAEPHCRVAVSSALASR